MAVFGFSRPAVVRQNAVVDGTPALGTLAVSTTALTFVSDGSSTATQTDTVLLTNSGAGSLAGPTIGTIVYDSGSGWLAAELLASNTIEVTVTPTGLTVGTYTATIPLTDVNADNTPLNLTVTFTIEIALRPPTIVVSGGTPGLFSAGQGGADPADIVKTISNGGDGQLVNLRVEHVDGAWLSEVLDTTEMTVTLSAAVAGLTAGRKEGHYRLLADGATNSPLNLGAFFDVIAQASSLVLSTDAAGFVGQVGGVNPADQSITISNGGGGSLGTLGIGTIVYGATATGWLSSSSVSGSVATLRAAIGSLPSGTHTATVPITASGAGNSPQNVNVSITLTPAPPPPGLIAFTPSGSVTFSGQEGASSPASKTVNVTDASAGQGGLGVVSLGAISYGSGSGWLAASLSNNVVTLTCTTGALTAATYTATLPVNANNATNTPQTITVSFTVAAAAAPQMVLTPNSLAFVAVAGAGNPANQTVAITNSGGGSLGTLGLGTITYAQGSGWASTTSLVGTTVTVRLVTGALTAGTYNCTIPVTSTTTATQNILVAFTVLSQATTFVQPIYTLPNFTSYSSTTDLVTIIAAGPMDRPYSPPGGGSVTTLGDAGSRAANQAALQAEVDTRAASDAGWTIKCTAGVDYGQLILKARPSGSAAANIYIISTAAASLPAVSDGRLSGGTTNRVRPADAPNMFKLSVASQSSNTVRAIRIADSTPNVSRYVIRGAEIAPTAGTFTVTTMVQLKPQTGTGVLANYPSYIELNQCYIHGVTLGPFGITVAIQFEVAYGKINDCWISHIGNSGNAEAKCLLSVTNPGPWSVQNTYIEAAGMGALFGSAEPAIVGFGPANSFWDRIHSNRPYAWNNRHPLYDGSYTGGNKNGFEFKGGDKICLQRFVVENCWLGGQDGDLITFKTAVPAGGSGSLAYLRNITLRHFFLLNGNGGLDLSGLANIGSYADNQFSRPQRIDCHSGVIALGNALDYAASQTAHHCQVVCGDMMKDTRLKRISGVCSDTAYGAWQWTTGNLKSDSITVEDCCFQAGNPGGFGPHAYDEGGPAAPPSPDEGRNVINTMVNSPLWQRVGIFLPGASFPTADRATLVPEHIVLDNTASTAIYADYDPADPAGSDYTIIHSSLTTSGVNGTMCGANWTNLAVHLTGVRN